MMRPKLHVPLAALLAVAARSAVAHDFAPSAEITVESRMVDGKVRWAPATSTVRKNAAVTLTVVNKTGAAETFAIPGLVEAAAVPAGGSRTFTFDADESGAYAFKPAGGKIIVLR